jgi:hypothetical protein
MKSHSHSQLELPILRHQAKRPPLPAQQPKPKPSVQPTPPQGELIAAVKLPTQNEAVALLATSLRLDENHLANMQVAARRLLRVTARDARQVLKAQKAASWATHKQNLAAARASWKLHQPIAKKFKPAIKKISAGLCAAITASDAKIFKQFAACRDEALANNTLATHIALTKEARPRVAAIYVCVVCGENFEAKRQAKTCSPACRQENHRKKEQVGQ